MRRRTGNRKAAETWPFPWHDQNAYSLREDCDCAVYCDGEAYFKAFAEAALQARSHIFILGWDIHTGTNLAPDLDPDGLSWTLDIFLRRLLDRHPELQIYILGWDFSPVFFLEREKLQSLRFSWSHHPRLHFVLDAHHPLGGSHHQKMVVIDDRLAFLGGLDLTVRRWDSSRHISRDPRRKDHEGEPYAPFHDLQIGIKGPAVEDLSQVFRERWLRATATRIRLQAPPPSESSTLPFAMACASFQGSRVAISRTSPLFRDYTEIKEIARLYIDLLRLARHTIYIENQYLTSQSIVDILCEIGAKERGPQILIVLPKKSGGWLEKKTMGLLQQSALQKILAADRYGRAACFFPFDKDLKEDGTYVTVHSKLLIIDDQFVNIGSANLNNRSMGFDTECNATIDVSSSPHLRPKVRQLMLYLLCHFSEVNESELARWVEDTPSLVELLKRIAEASPDRHLAPFAIPSKAEEVWLDADVLDRERPTPIEIAIDRWGKVSEAINRRLGLSPRRAALALTGGVALLIALLWSYTPMANAFDHETLERLMAELKPGEGRTLIVLPLLFALGSLVFFPINLLVILTASLFPIAWAFAYIFLGVIANTLTGYGLGQIAGRYFFRQFFGRRTRDVLNRIGEGNFFAILLLRIVPIAPAAVINLAAGAGRIPLLKFLAATIVGMAPGTLMLVFFQKSIMDLFKSPSWGSVLSVCALSAVAFGLYRWSRDRFSNYGA